MGEYENIDANDFFCIESAEHECWAIRRNSYVDIFCMFFGIYKLYAFPVFKSAFNGTIFGIGDGVLYIADRSLYRSSRSNRRVVPLPSSRWRNRAAELSAVCND